MAASSALALPTEPLLYNSFLQGGSFKSVVLNLSVVTNDPFIGVAYQIFTVVKLKL